MDSNRRIGETATDFLRAERDAVIHRQEVNMPYGQGNGVADYVIKDHTGPRIDRRSCVLNLSPSF